MRIVIVSLVAALAACVSGTPSSVFDQGGDDVVTEGGRLTLEQCGYDVVTRIGASAPELGSAELGTDPTPRHVHLGIAGDAHTSMVVQWRTVDETTLATTVQYGQGASLSVGELDRSQEGVTFIYISGFAQNGERVRLHETHLCGLEPDTEYSYRVGGQGIDGSEVWSEIFTFRTAPDPVAQPEATVVFGNLGDSRDGYDMWEQLIALTASHQPDLILFSGDAVTIGAIQVEWEVFFEVAEPVLARIPMISAHGNHDVNAINYYSQLALPGDEEDYALRYGPVQLVVLNDTPADSSNILGKSAELIDTTFAETSAPWKIAMHHIPLFSASTRHGSDMTLREAWQPIFDLRDVDMVLAGHDHDYERSKPMLGNAEAAPGDGTVYIVSGGAGAGLYGNGTDFWTAFSAKTHSTVLITVTGSTMIELAAYREDGSLIDQMPAIVKGGQ